MRVLRAHPLLSAVLALALSAAAVVAIAGAYGFGAFAHAWSHLTFGWLALAFFASVLGIAGYLLSYRAVVAFDGGPRLKARLLLWMVVAGFGPSAPSGGFALDKRALHVLHGDDEEATVRVLGLGALEWALLAPAAWLSAVVLLAGGDRRPTPSLLWPWALAVPAGFAVGLWLAMPSRRERIARGRGGWRARLGTALDAVGILLSLGRGWQRCWTAWVGTALYWALDIAALYAALRFVGVHLGPAETIVAFATGYALTRRSLPLAGAGVTEALMTFALHWTGVAVMPALAAVVVYRAFNFLLPTVPALLVRHRVYTRVAETPRARTSSRRRRRLASGLLGHLQR